MIKAKELSELLDLGKDHLYLYGYLAYCNKEMKMTYEEISKLLGINKRYVKKILDDLCNLIECKQKSKQGRASYTKLILKSVNKKVNIKIRYSDEEMESAKTLLKLIKESNHKAINLDKVKIDKWANQIRLLNNKVKDINHINHVIDATFKNPFWSQVIQSPMGLTKNYNKLVSSVLREEIQKEKRAVEDKKWEEEWLNED